MEFRLECSSGTYVRTLAEDMAKSLNTVGTVVNLVRESIGSFSLDRAISGDQLKIMTPEELWQKAAS